ncbi:hypothetical protein ACA910_021346 [Epithemia clementina (nom. ined.)]
MTSFWDFVYSTFLASIRSVGTACTLAAAGTYMHQRGFISVPGKRMLALMSQQVTFPLFLFTNIINCNQDWSAETCPSVTESLRQVWILLFWPLVVVSLGILVGQGVSYVCQTPHNQRKSVMAAVAFSNSTGLPITLLTVVHTNFSKTSELGKVDPTLFLSVYLLLYPVLQWGLGGWLLAPSKDDSLPVSPQAPQKELLSDVEAQQQNQQLQPNAQQQPVVSQQQRNQLEEDDNDTLNTLTSTAGYPSPPSTTCIITEPVLEEAESAQALQPPLLLPLNDAAVDAAPAEDADPATQTTPRMTSIRSSFKINVLNNKTLDEHYLRHRHGLYSSDEGLYLSEANLSTLAAHEPPPPPDNEMMMRMMMMASQYNINGNIANPKPVSLYPTSTTATAVPTTDTAALPEGASNINGNNIENPRAVPTATAVAVGGTSQASSDGTPEFLLYDSDSTSRGSPNTSSHQREAAVIINGNGAKDDDGLNALSETQPLLGHHDTTYGATPTTSDHSPSHQHQVMVQDRSFSFRQPNGHSPRNGGIMFMPPKAPSTSPPPSPTPSFSEYKGESIWVSIQNIAERCFQPPVVGAVSGILVAISPARALFVDVVDRDADAPLEWLFDGLYSIGLTAVPINMIILGCNLSNSYNKLRAASSSTTPIMTSSSPSNPDGTLVVDATTSSDNSAPAVSEKEGLLDMTTMIGIVVGKMVVMPILGFFLAWFLNAFVLDIPDDIDAAFYLVLLIVFLTPTANNVMVMVELSGSNTKEGIANVIAMQFAVAPIILSCTLTMAIGYARGM